MALDVAVQVLSANFIPHQRPFRMLFSWLALNIYLLQPLINLYHHGSICAGIMRPGLIINEPKFSSSVGLFAYFQYIS